MLDTGNIYKRFQNIYNEKNTVTTEEEPKISKTLMAKNSQSMQETQEEMSYAEQIYGMIRSARNSLKD